ncbi:LuxR C-terminal-related transcriptional regulator, partial [Klebsiella pneumoniae]
KKIIHGDIVFVVKSEILADPVENIIINSISTIVLDYIDVTQRLQKYLLNASDHRCIKVFRKSISSLDSCVNIKLTKQEDSLLPYIISGLNNKKIAQATDLSNMMISHYRRNIYQKLNVRNIAGLYHFLHSLEGG